MNNQIKFYRRQLDMTQEDLAGELGQKQSSISNYENGQRQPDIETAKNIVAAFAKRGLSVGLDDLFQASAAS